MNVIPICGLSRDESPPADKAIRAIVSLFWPYSSSTEQCALLLAEPDFRLRNSRGQVRVRFAGVSAGAVAQAKIGIGDELLLDLKGARWAREESHVNTPGKSVDGELTFQNQLNLALVKKAGGIQADTQIVVDGSIQPSEDLEPTVQRGRGHAPGSATPTRATPPPTRKSLGGADVVPIYSSPAFMKRLRFSEAKPSWNIFGDLDAEFPDLPNKKQRTSLNGRSTWRFVGGTPSLEKQTQAKDIEVLGSPLRRASNDVKIERVPPVTSKSKDTSAPGEEALEQITPQASSQTTFFSHLSGTNDAGSNPSMPPPPLPRLQVPVSPSPHVTRSSDALQTVGPSTPKLNPVPSSALPLPSPFPNESVQLPFVEADDINRNVVSSNQTRSGTFTEVPIGGRDAEAIERRGNTHLGKLPSATLLIDADEVADVDDSNQIYSESPEIRKPVAETWSESLVPAADVADESPELTAGGRSDSQATSTRDPRNHYSQRLTRAQSENLSDTEEDDELYDDHLRQQTQIHHNQSHTPLRDEVGSQRSNASQLDDASVRKAFESTEEPSEGTGVKCDRGNGAQATEGPQIESQMDRGFHGQTNPGVSNETLKLPPQGQDLSEVFLDTKIISKKARDTQSDSNGIIRNTEFSETNPERRAAAPATPFGPPVGLFGLERASGSSSAPKTTFQPDRDTIMKRTYSSLFGFRASPSPERTEPSTQLEEQISHPVSGFWQNSPVSSTIAKERISAAGSILGDSEHENGRQTVEAPQVTFASHAIAPSEKSEDIMLIADIDDSVVLLGETDNAPRTIHSNIDPDGTAERMNVDSAIEARAEAPSYPVESNATAPDRIQLSQEDVGMQNTRPVAQHSHEQSPKSHDGDGHKPTPIEGMANASTLCQPEHHPPTVSDSLPPVTQENIVDLAAKEEQPVVEVQVQPQLESAQAHHAATELLDPENSSTSGHSELPQTHARQSSTTQTSQGSALQSELFGTTQTTADPSEVHTPLAQDENMTIPETMLDEPLPWVVPGERSFFAEQLPEAEETTETHALMPTHQPSAGGLMSEESPFMSFQSATSVATDNSGNDAQTIAESFTGIHDAIEANQLRPESAIRNSQNSTWQAQPNLMEQTDSDARKGARHEVETVRQASVELSVQGSAQDTAIEISMSPVTKSQSPTQRKFASEVKSQISQQADFNLESHDTQITEDPLTPAVTQVAQPFEEDINTSTLDQELSAPSTSGNTSQVNVGTTESINTHHDRLVKDINSSVSQVSEVEQTQVSQRQPPQKAVEERSQKFQQEPGVANLPSSARPISPENSQKSVFENFESQTHSRRGLLPTPQLSQNDSLWKDSNVIEPSADAAQSFNSVNTRRALRSQSNQTDNSQSKTSVRRSPRKLQVDAIVHEERAEEVQPRSSPSSPTQGRKSQQSSVELLLPHPEVKTAPRRSPRRNPQSDNEALVEDVSNTHTTASRHVTKMDASKSVVEKTQLDIEKVTPGRRSSRRSEAREQWSTTQSRLSEGTPDIRPAFEKEDKPKETPPQRSMGDRSFNTRLGSVPDLISNWFSPRRQPRQEADAKEPRADTAAEKTQKSAKSSGLSTSLAYFTALAHIEEKLNVSSQSFADFGIDILAVVADGTKEPQRCKNGPRDYVTVFKITDPSIGDGHSIRVETYRPFHAMLPVAHPGDVLLLRAFVVKSRKRQSYLLSTDASAWCVWRYTDLEHTPEGKGKLPATARRTRSTSFSAVREEVKGPPVELGDEERRKAEELRAWWLSSHRSQDPGKSTSVSEDTR